MIEMQFHHDENLSTVLLLSQKSIKIIVHPTKTVR